MAATTARKALLKKKDVTTFPDEEISFFRIKGISIILIMAYQNLVSNAIMKVLLKVKHINKFAYKKKLNTRLNLRTEAMQFDANMCLLIVTIISNACIFETKL